MLLVVFDTARADAFEPYGAPAGSSPAVAQLASRGAAHPRAYAPACWTVPSHGSMFSGRPYRSAGFQHRGAQGAPGYKAACDALAADGSFLPAVLAKAGHETRGVSANAWIHARTGFDAGFEHFEPVRGHRVRASHGRDLRSRLRWQYDAIRAVADDGATQIEELLADWVRRRDRRPFFWFVNLVECHSPYMPPKPFNDLSALERAKAAREATEWLTLGSVWKSSLGRFEVPDDALVRMRRLYAASIRQLDAWLARVLDSLDRGGMLEDTQVVVTSDHGENFGEGGLLAHAFSLDDRLLRVPLVTAGPARPPDGAVFPLASLAGYLADVGGVDDHPFHDHGVPDGIAVAQFDSPAEGNAAAIAKTVDAYDLDAAGAERLRRSFTCATDGRYKLLRVSGGGEELVDLDRDPLELHPRTPDDGDGVPADVLARLRQAIDDVALAERPKAVARTEERRGDEAEFEEQLRQLGYLE